MKKPDWVKNITVKMVVVWAVCFVAFLVVAFGSVALGLGVSKVTYGANQLINKDNIFYVEYRNENHTKQLLNIDETMHAQPIGQMLDHLRDGGKTNKLANLFRGNPTRYTVGNNNVTDSLYMSSFTHKYSQNSIIIWLVAPQHSIEANAAKTSFSLKASTQDSNATQIYAICIPLDNIENRFQEQTWFLLTRNPNTISIYGALTMANVVTTHGNYYQLGKFVNDLYVRL